MLKRHCLLSIVIMFLLCSLAHGQKYSWYDFDPVVITGTRIPTEFSNSSRNINVISQEDIQEQNAPSIVDLLQNITDLEFKTRGPLGVQSDVSIRGSSGEQTLILIDGMKISDPQTAHHSMNIPVNLEDIKQIEILKGNASKIYGPNALGGVINIITKNAEKANASVSLAGGEYGYRNTGFSYSQPINNFTNRLSFSEKASDGYMDNTDFLVRNIFYKAGLNTNRVQYDLSLGYQKKEFGANKFYTPSPTERENTEQFLANFNAFLPTRWGHLSMKVSGRRNYDHFLIPEYKYVNKHTTRMIATEINGLYESEHFSINFGSDIGYNDISGMQMNHHRTRAGLFAETIIEITDKLTLSPGISGYYYENWGTQFFPGIDAGYQITETIRLFSSVGRSFRVPSFTDLFYSGVANMGNAHLKPEKALSGELGGRIARNKLQTSMTLFHRNITDMIDFARTDTSVVFVAMNVPKLKTSGLEFSCKYQLNTFTLHSLGFNYSYFNHQEELDEYQLKNQLNSLTQRWSFNVSQRLPKQLHINWAVRYSERVFDKGAGRLITDFHSQIPLGKFNIHLKIDNLFDTNYENFLARPMPGRWTTFGIKYEF